MIRRTGLVQLSPDTAAFAPRLVTGKAVKYQRLRSEFAELSMDKVAALEDVAVAEGTEENMTVVEAIAVVEEMEENMTVVELMGADATVEEMEEYMTVGVRGHCTCMIAAALAGEESVVAAAAVAMENGEGSRAVAGTMAHWQLDRGEKRPRIVLARYCLAFLALQERYCSLDIAVPWQRGI